MKVVCGVIICQKQNSEIQTDLKEMEKPRSLQSMLRDHSITADEFFQVQGIAQQIRSNLDRFVTYCRKHRQFTHRMITLALNITYSELEDKNLKSASHAINEVLGNEETAIAQLFFQSDLKTNSEASDIPQELDGGIQSQAQRLFRFDDDEQNEMPQQQRANELEKYQLVGLSLQILRAPQRNETCLGHLHKIYSFLIRHNPRPVLVYFDQNKEKRQLLLGNLRYSSVSSLVAQLLTSEDKSKVYEHQGFKKQIIQFIIVEMFRNIEDQGYFDGLMILIEQIINTTKQSYYDYFQDFKRVSNLLVSKDIMKQFYNIILKKEEKSFRNASKFLEYLFIRINTEREDNNYYNRGEQAQPSMNFQIDIFYENLNELIAIIPLIQLFPSLTKISYLSFLDAMFSSTKIKAYHYSLKQQSFIALLDCYNKQEKAGVYKNKLYTLVNAIISKAEIEQTNEFLSDNQNLYQKYFSNIKVANYSNSKVYNKNEGSAFDISIIKQLSKKNESVIGDATKAIGKDFKRICKKYETKIASFQNNSFSIEEQSNFYQYNNQVPTGKPNQNTNPTNFSLNLVGKNNISIPILHLPERNHTESDENKERQNSPNKRLQTQNSRTSGVKQVYEVQEVVVLTDSFQKLNLENCSGHMSSPPELNRIQNDELRRIDVSPVKPVIIQEPIINQPKVKEIKKCGQDSENKIRFYSRHLHIYA